MNMDLSASWIDVENQQHEEPPSPTSSCMSFCALPPLTPNFDGPIRPYHPLSTEPVRTVSSMQESLQNADAKAELHRVLQAVQCSTDFGVYFCESFRDPRRHYIDDYWQEVEHEALGIEELHRAVGKVDSAPLSDEACARMHQFARLLERLARRIDRVVLH